MPTVALLVSYNGAPFHGFARQPGAIATVQDTLEEALATVYRRPVDTVCAGRTDTGVHALGQVVSFELSEDEFAARPLRTLVRSLNALTHEAVGVRDAVQAPEGFSARFDARSRTYRYFVSDAPVAPLIMREFCWHVRSGALDVGAMNEAAAYLIGEHDFKSFCVAASAVDKPTHRYVGALSVRRVEMGGEGLVSIDITGNAFLHSMVRTIAGTLVAVGRGLRQPAWVDEVLRARDREAAGEKAPAAGLVFWNVAYDNLEWKAR